MSRTARKWLCLHALTRDQFVQFLFSFCSVCSAFDMHSCEIVELAKEKHANGFSYRRISQEVKLPRSTVQYMIKNDYSRVKAKRGPNHVAVGCKKLRIKQCIALLKKTQRKGDSLKNHEGDSPQNQQKNGSSSFIKNEV